MSKSKRTVILPFPPSSNTAYATDWKTRRRYKSKAAQEWETEAFLRCHQAFQGWNLPPNTMLAMHLRLAFPDARRADAQNYLKLPCDVVVEALALDDNQHTLPLVTVESMGIMKGSPMCEVTVRVIGHVLGQGRRKKAA